jgi:biopolymer transport protein ExbD
MAGVNVGEDAENPVAINITALVDIIFCLCVFFMISFKFKQIEGKFDTWLPKNAGLIPFSPTEELPKEIRIAMFWDETAEKVTRQLGTRKVETSEELEVLIRQARDDFDRLGVPEIPVTVDADSRVPWNDVIDVVNLCKRVGIGKIQFALGAPPPKKK